MKPSSPVLDREGIARRIPHQGTMCLLESLQAWDAAGILCRTGTHRDPANPLRTASGLLAPAAIEYAAQAMALHGSLVAPAEGGPSAGYLASVRGVRLACERLDTLSCDVTVRAERLAGDDRQVLYRFSVATPEGEALAEGRATVVLNTPLEG